MPLVKARAPPSAARAEKAWKWWKSLDMTEITHLKADKLFWSQFFGNFPSTKTDFCKDAAAVEKVEALYVQYTMFTGGVRRTVARGTKRTRESQESHSSEEDDVDPPHAVESPLRRILPIARRYPQRPQPNAFLAFDDGSFVWIGRIQHVYAKNLARVKNAKIRVHWLDISARETAGVNPSNISDINFPVRSPLPMDARNAWILGFDYPGFSKLAHV